MTTLIAMVMAAMAAMGALGGHSAPEELMGPPIYHVEDAIIWCADEFEDPHESLDCMDAAKVSGLPTAEEYYAALSTLTA